MEDGAGKIIPGKEYRFTEDDYCVASCTAWFSIYTILDAMELRHKAAEILNDPYTILFMKAFGEAMPDLAANKERDRLKDCKVTIHREEATVPATNEDSKDDGQYVGPFDARYSIRTPP